MERDNGNRRDFSADVIERVFFLPVCNDDVIMTATFLIPDDVIHTSSPAEKARGENPSVRTSSLKNDCDDVIMTSSARLAFFH